MDRCRVYLAALVAAAVVGAGCARSEPAAPVSAAPVTESNPDSGRPPSAAPVQQPTPPDQPAAPVQQPAPAVKPPAFLQQILDAGWRLSVLKGLPPRERPAEDKGQRELIYEGGALRLYRDGQDTLYALVVDHTHPAFQEFKSLTSGGSFTVAHQGKYTSVLRTAPISESMRTELASREWTQAELTARFGEPTSRVHNHGIGTYTVTYVPQGLVFEEAKTLKLSQTPAEDVWRQAAESLVYGPNNIDEILEKGKPSPDGRFRAGHLEGGGYWSQWIVVRETGKSETSYHAQYFIANYFWLDNRRVVYGEVQIGRPYLFHVIDVVAEKELDSITVDDEVKEFGPAVGNQIWYTGKDGLRHHLTLP
jgi:hypothetical protein